MPRDSEGSVRCVMAQQDHLPDDGGAQSIPAALWRRFVAFLVDAAILGLPTLGVGIAYFDAAARLGEWGRLVGLVLALLYFTFFDSWWAEGRSPGKRLLRLTVMGKDGALLTPAMAALRASILYTPILLNGMPINEDVAPMVQGLLVLLTLGLLLCLAYLFLFNRSRRSLHDLIAGAIVVDARGPQAPFLRPVWKGHWLVVGCICALTFAAPLIGSLFNVGQGQEVLRWRATRASVAALPSVRTVQVGWGRTSIATLRTGIHQFDRVNIIVQLRARPMNYEAVARQIEDAIFAEHAEHFGQAEVLIIIRYGFNFGVAVANNDFGVVTSLAKWRAKTQRRET